MPILSSELLLHPGTDRTQESTEGGRMDSSVTLTSARAAEVVRDITEAERTDGVLRHYKLFFHVANAGNTPYSSKPKIFLDAIMEGTDYVASLREGTQISTWADVSSAARTGTGTLNAPVSAGGSSLVVDTRGASYAHFQTGRIIFISDLADEADETGNRQYMKITARSWSGDQVTLTVSRIDEDFNEISGGLKYDFATSRIVSSETVKTRVGTALTYGDADGEVKGDAETSSNTSTHGTFDDTAVVVDFIGTVEQTVTLTFDSATTFTATSDVLGALAAGAKGSSYAPQNPNFSRPYFTIPAAAWTNDGSGDWQSGDSIQLHITPVAMPFHLDIDIPAGSAAAGIQLPSLVVDGVSGSA